MAAGAQEALLWWQTGVIYQIYPRSWQDSTGNGIGDLEGIRRQLDYLTWLGIDAVWISPIYPSPMADFGYDISDYTDVHPLFGSLADVDRLIAEVHARGLKIILDLVPNHSSDEHPWFAESRSSRDNAKRDWYLWRDAKADRQPPNNWLSVFGGSAWEWDEQTGQFYYHAFLKKQPDLNWRNPEVRAAMHEVIRFWLGRGIDGFRVDVMWHLIKDAALRDNPPNPDYREGQREYNRLLHVYSTDQPEVHEVVAEMRSLVDDYDERVLIGEIYLPIPELVTYYGRNGRGAHLPFNFQLIVLPWEAERIYATIAEYEAALPPTGWPNWVLGNHDQPRIASRVGRAQARVAAMLLLTLRGTPTIYYGDEIGMSDGDVPPELIQDPQALNADDPSLSRDPHRTPMQWDASKHAGFTSGEPWLPVSADADKVNVAAERKDSQSMLSLHRRLLELRAAEPALHCGSWSPLCIYGDAFAYVRAHAGRRFVIALNLGTTRATLTPAERVSGEVVLDTSASRPGTRIDGAIELAANEGIVVLSRR
ncbi:alpha-amylase family glycosyl hydrolase [soil metagenome]